MEITTTVSSSDTLPVPVGTQPNNPALLYLVSLESKESRRTIASRLNQFAKILGCADWGAVDWGRMDREWLYLAREHLTATGKTTRTINGMYVALKGVSGQAWELGLIADRAYQRIQRTKSLKVTRVPRHNVIEPEIMRELVNACAHGEPHAGLRDAALLSIGFGCGLRRSEIVGIDIQDINQSEKRILVRGKRNKERYVFVPGPAWEALSNWMSTLKKTEGAIFRRIWKSGQISERRLNDSAVRKILLARAELIGVEGLRPHDLRASFITMWLDAGEDVFLIAKAVSHQNVATTQIYDRRPLKAQQKLAQRITW